MEKWLDFSLSASDMCLKKRKKERKTPLTRIGILEGEREEAESMK